MTDIKKGFDYPWDVVNAIPAETGRKVIVQFADWSVRELDLGPIIFGSQPGVFADLREDSFFRRLRVLDGVLTWPGEIDLDSEAIYSETH